ncbi:hypothetical protein HYH03_015886 [Edaphochlamys debaryana]|uniref:Uncharacterized protein n=1 Tax=Edaphochlamys debaryana TaxID=47281 RepID=A0A835XL33_9CHLO|nr:hypothetical protein HYH03_015886 [Edaphochlamys debaryana]|eukprot:KAG2485400.1 hypothetical protein HYH03_015886 [Edaphochlamys debaryana]
MSSPTAPFFRLFKGFKLPADAYVLALPVTYACVAFTALLYRPVAQDPDTSTAAYYEDESKVAAVAQKYDNDYKHFFTSRIANHQTGVFNNWFAGTRQ